MEIYGTKTALDAPMRDRTHLGGQNATNCHRHPNHDGVLKRAETLHDQLSAAVFIKRLGRKAISTESTKRHKDTNHVLQYAVTAQRQQSVLLELRDHNWINVADTQLKTDLLVAGEVLHCVQSGIHNGRQPLSVQLLSHFRLGEVVDAGRGSHLHTQVWRVLVHHRQDDFDDIQPGLRESSCQSEKSVQGFLQEDGSHDVASQGFSDLNLRGIASDLKSSNVIWASERRTLTVSWC